MANADQGNLIYLDTTADSIRTDSVNVFFVVVSPTMAGGYIELLDGASGDPLIKLIGATASDSKIFDFSLKPINLSKGVHVTVSNAVATLVYRPVGRN